MKTTNIFRALLLGFTLAAFTGCGEDLEKADYDRVHTPETLPAVTTVSAEAFGIVAKATLSVTVPEGVTVKESGFALGTTPDADPTAPTTRVIMIDNMTPGEAVTTSLTNLTSGTKYYIKAFATVEGGIAYGEVKEFTATDDYGYTADYAADFTDPAAVSADFKAVKLGNTVNPFTLVPLDGMFGPGAGYGFSSSVFAPDFYQTGNASIASFDENNLLTYEADFTGKNFPTVTVGAFNIAAFFGQKYPTNPGSFDVLLSESPITTADELSAATRIGTCTFSTNPSDTDKFQYKVVTYDVPLQFDGKCYITIHNHATFVNGGNGGNFGMFVDHFELSSLKKKTAQ